MIFRAMVAFNNQDAVVRAPLFRAQMLAESITRLEYYYALLQIFETVADKSAFSLSWRRCRHFVVKAKSFHPPLRSSTVEIRQGISPFFFSFSLIKFHQFEQVSFLHSHFNSSLNSFRRVP